LRKLRSTLYRPPAEPGRRSACGRRLQGG
jgi:hypothetical protein